MRPSLLSLAGIALLCCACGDDSGISGPENPSSSSNASPYSSPSAYSSQGSLYSSSSSSNASSSSSLAQAPLLSGQDCAFDSTWNGGKSYKRVTFRFNGDGSFKEEYHALDAMGGVGQTNSEKAGLYTVEKDSLLMSFASGDEKFGYSLGEDQNYRLSMPQISCSNTRGNIYQCSEYWIELKCQAR